MPQTSGRGGVGRLGARKFVGQHLRIGLFESFPAREFRSVPSKSSFRVFLGSHSTDTRQRLLTHKLDFR